MHSQGEAALGALLGACVGDAAGGPLEGWPNIPTEADVAWALTMPGGGVWRLAPGQVTDDSELALCLARALAPLQHFDLDAIAREYRKWVHSSPFDIGNTTRASLGCRIPGQHGYDIDFTAIRAAHMQAAAADRCMASKANGSLMRCMALGIWGWHLSSRELTRYARLDSSLSHPNPSCCDAVACYTLGLAHLIRMEGDVVGAINEMEQWVTREACEEVKAWFALARGDEEVPGRPYQGFVKIAFIHALRHLERRSGYEEALRATLRIGGDTDTNACIVGGLVGAACGYKAIPKALREAVLHCETRRGRGRPSWLHPRQVPQLVEQLLFEPAKRKRQ